MSIVLGQQSYTVSEFISVVKEILETDLSTVQVEGEVSNLSFSTSGHIYFSLVDRDALVSAVMFKSDFLRNPLARQLKDGAQVVVFGGVNVYQKRGTFQIVVRKLMLKGQGDLKEKFELLKKKLASEGLFNLERKKKIPTFPKKVALITAPNGAAVHDFVNIYSRRGVFIKIIVVPVLVQGEKAPSSIIKGLDLVLKYNRVNEADPCDVVVLARGGGSLEDLWAFNDETLAYKLCDYPVPTVSAIGHDVDFVLTDYVADLRAETPSAAAENLTKHQVEIVQKMAQLKRRLHDRMMLDLSAYQSKIEVLHPRKLIKHFWQFLTNYRTRLETCNLVYRGRDLVGISDFSLRLEEAIETLKVFMAKAIQVRVGQLDRLNGILEATSPRKVLERGYCLAKFQSKHVILSMSEFDKVDTNTTLSLVFHDGEGLVTKN
ncbi:MAG: exodeoxyribonuclease VII large subunit [Bdellovibrio sp.]|nr:exodeoxyribonuclease VII large subunit [Bdellovibrio sp.]